MQTVERLIKKFKPSNYQLSLTIDRVNRLFRGTAVISGDVLSNDNQILFHSKDLDIESVAIDGKAASFKLAGDILSASHPSIKNGKHIIVIGFNGKITDSMHGIYPCYYSHDNKPEEIIATQFESHHAREVFPCIDEPEAKATFDLTLTCETGVEVLSNVPIKKQYVEDDALITSFETTPPMSTYLLAWVVGKLQKKSTTTKNGVAVNVWSTPNQPLDNLDFALDIAKRSIEFFDDYLQTPYPLPKCDHVALPDFAAGAMENWGLITYREIALLVDPKTTSISAKQYVATVIAHELSHQWFGNLVTMKWWDDLWLNESFASLAEYAAVDALESSWDVWMDFASFDVVTALKRDSLKGVQSVKTDVNHPDEIGTLFDGAIVYAKGAHLMQMLKSYIGEACFKKGLQKYFEKFTYKNTEAADLWEVLSEVSKKDIGKFMEKWLNQPGFPVLKVSRNNNQLLLSQSSIDGDKNKLWPILLNSNADNIQDVLEEREITLDYKPGIKPLRFNLGNHAHFVTDYDEYFLDLILDKIKNNQLEAIDRLQFLNEQSILASAGFVSNARIVKIIGYFKDETSEQVWDLILIAISELKKFVENDKAAEEKLHELVNALIEKQYSRLGWQKTKGESESDSKLRNVILNLALYAKNKDAMSQSINLYNSSSVENFNPNIRSLIISGAVKYSQDRSLFNDLIKKYKEIESSEIGQSICVGLTSTKDESEIKTLLPLLKDKMVVRTQDISRWFAYLIRNKCGKEIVWRWTKENWFWIKDTFEGDKSYDEYPRYIASVFNTQKQLEEYEKFFKPHLKNPALKRVISIGIDEISQRVKLIEKDSKAVIEELNNLQF